VGIHCYDHVRWQDYVAQKDFAWTKREMELAIKAFESVFSERALVIGAAGWQLNAHVLALEEQFGFQYASDLRGDLAFYPMMDGIRSSCPQLPTTLPTLDELIGENDITADNVHQAVFESSRRPLAHGHVYTLHAELEGMQLLPVMDRLLTMWKTAGDNVGTMQDNYLALDLTQLENRSVTWGTVAGRSGLLATVG
jgi:peptidoglycan/xylan/chitin deacetylase (PgdA/CDA1 family)